MTDLETRLINYLRKKPPEGVCVRAAARSLHTSQSAIIDTAEGTHTLEIDGVAVRVGGGSGVGAIKERGDWFVRLPF